MRIWKLGLIIGWFNIQMGRGEVEVFVPGVDYWQATANALHYFGSHEYKDVSIQWRVYQS